MSKKSKFISGLQEKNIVGRMPSQYFTETEKHAMIHDLLNSRKTKQEIWKKHTGREEEHGTLLRWMRELGYMSVNKQKRFNFTSDKNQSMLKKNKTVNDSVESFEMQQLKKRISELEQQLKDAEMKAIAFSTMVDIAEQEFNIPIRKKYNTKPSKQ